MADTFQFWTHGVDVIPEYTKEYTNSDNGLYMRRAGWGAQIKQYIGTENWFHFAIPSAIELNSKPLYYHHDPDPQKPQPYNAWLRVRLNEFAVIDRVHFREAPGPKSNSKLIHDSGPLKVTNQDTELKFKLPGKQCKGPLVMCVHVKFIDAWGEVVFAGAGVWLEEAP